MASVVFQPFLPLLLKPNFATLRRGVPSALSLIAHRLPGVALSRSIVISFALTNSNASASLDDEAILPLLQELSACLGLPPDYLSKLPGDLRLDLNDAAFDLASGPVFEECGKEFGELFSSLSRAWEQADTMTSNIIANNLPSLHDHLTKDVKQAIGKRLLSAGRRFEAMGQYGEGELQKIAKAMIKVGKLLSKGPIVETEKKPNQEVRTFKFGELQVAVTPEKAFIGAVIAAAFGLLSWELSQGIQNIPDSSFQYANDNAVILAKSLRGALLVLGYSSTVLSAFVLVGLLLLGRQLSSESNSNEQ